jgi:hypothetical protein
MPANFVWNKSILALAETPALGQGLVVFLPMAVQAARTWIRREVTIEFQGRNASGRYLISRGTITVSTIFYGCKSTHVGGSTPASLARIMLCELGRVLVNPVL